MVRTRGITLDDGAAVISGAISTNYETRVSDSSFAGNTARSYGGAINNFHPDQGSALDNDGAATRSP